MADNGTKGPYVASCHVPELAKLQSCLHAAEQPACCSGLELSAAQCASWHHSAAGPCPANSTSSLIDDSRQLLVAHTHTYAKADRCCKLA